MEPAKIAWNNVTWVFSEDERYEHMNAPKWFDFAALDDPVDDVAWFCRPDCNHPQTAEDFLKSTPSSKKQGNAYKTLLLSEMNQRDTSIKRKGLPPSPVPFATGIEDSENQNPNLSTPINHHTTTTLKAAIKSSSEKKKATDEPPRLRSTLSARNLFGGHNIFSHISEFVGELKRLALRPTKERGENREQLHEEKKANSKVGSSGDILVGEKDRKPLLQVSEARSDASPASIVKEKQKLKRREDDAENTPISLNMDKVRSKRQEVLSQIRTSPPTPQGFSATRGPARTTPQKATKSRLLMESQILQELKPPSKEEVVAEDETENRAPVSNFEGKEAKPPLDLFWLLKPCTPTS